MTKIKRLKKEVKIEAEKAFHKMGKFNTIKNNFNEIIYSSHCEKCGAEAKIIETYKFNKEKRFDECTLLNRKFIFGGKAIENFLDCPQRIIDK